MYFPVSQRVNFIVHPNIKFSSFEIIEPHASQSLHVSIHVSNGFCGLLGILNNLSQMKSSDVLPLEELLQ